MKKKKGVMGAKPPKSSLIALGYLLSTNITSG
jgi:hypothetical protein